MTINPFSITKANDLNDEQILDYWVDFSTGDGFKSLIDPHELTPKVILGGKGSGKTHILRYFSFPLQCVRADGRRIIDVVNSDGYVGIYVLCGGLDASRFSGKEQGKQTWATLFTYYMDLWLAHCVLDIFRQFTKHKGLRFERVEEEFYKRIMELFDSGDLERPRTMDGILILLRKQQREIDYAVNNAAITGQLKVTIRSSPGRLVFGIPEIITSMFPVLSDVNFLYLIDELENIELEHQKYINTLVRERRGPATFRLGARNYGIRTRKTLAAQEENRPGSEFDLHRLDDYLRDNKQRYRVFSKKLVISRLQQGGFIDKTSCDGIDLDRYFESGDESRLGHLDVSFVLTGSGDRPYFRRLKKQLTEFHPKMTALGLSSIEDVKNVIERLRVPDRPLLEKINILFLYRAWYRRLNLIEASTRIAHDCERYCENGPDLSRYAVTVQHFAIDMYAQLCREYHRRFHYRGMDVLITLSDGVPRNLLILLKAIYKWARFAGEKPFTSEPISSKAQYRGVLEATEWFFTDAPVGGGQAALDARNAVGRLGQLFRELVYSDKPPECSLSTFSANVTGATVRNMLDLAESFSLLVKIPGGQKDRNTGRVDDKYQINRMLVPLWVLPVARRGTVALSSKEIRIVFAPESNEEFNRMKAERIARANVPFQKSNKRQSRKRRGTMPPTLFEDLSDV